MKRLLMLILLPAEVLFAQEIFAQSASFDFGNSTWTTDSTFNESTFADAREIRLFRLRIPEDSIKNSPVVWTFDDSLVVSFYDASSAKDSLIGTYEYKAITDKLDPTAINPEVREMLEANSTR